MDRMSNHEIIQHSEELKDSGMDWKHAYATVLATVQAHKYRIMRAGNTLFGTG